MIRIYCVRYLFISVDHYKYLFCYIIISAVEEYKFLLNLKSKLSNDSDEIGENDVNKFFIEFEAYHNDKTNLKTALSPCKVS